MNKVVLQGRLSKSVELAYTANNTAYAKFSIAVNRRYTPQGQEQQADFLNCIAWGKTGEFLAKYFAKGQLILAEGRIENNTYEKDGQKRYATNIVVEQVYFCGAKSNTNLGQADTDPFLGGEDALPFS